MAATRSCGHAVPPVCCRAARAGPRCPPAPSAPSRAQRFRAPRAVEAEEAVVEAMPEVELPGEVTDAECAAMVAANGFPIAPDDLIAKAKAVVKANNGCDDPDLLAESFQFVAPVVGPIGKSEFTEAFASFKLSDAFPDLKGNFYNFHVDPFEPGRVWFMTRSVGTHTGVLAGAVQPTGIKVESPPQAASLKFDADGKCTQLTAGYVLDKTIGNTGGLGGVFGIIYAVAPNLLPFPEAQPWEKSWQYSFFTSFQGFTRFAQQALKQISGEK